MVEKTTQYDGFKDNLVATIDTSSIIRYAHWCWLKAFLNSLLTIIKQGLIPISSKSSVLIIISSNNKAV